MTDIIKVEARDGRETVDARSLHMALEVGRVFGAWIQDRIEKFGFVEGNDYETRFPDLESEMHGGQNRKEYALSVAMAKELAMVENNDKGREVRRYLIQLEEAWNTPELVIARALQVASVQLENATKRIALMEPKAKFYDTVAGSKTAIHMNEVAKTIDVPGMGRNNLFLFLRDQGVLMANSLPYQEHVDTQRFRVIQQTYTNAKTLLPIITHTTLVYQKGIDFILKLLAKHGHFPRGVAS